MARLSSSQVRVYILTYGAGKAKPPVINNMGLKPIPREFPVLFSSVPFQTWDFREQGPIEVTSAENDLIILSIKTTGE